MPLTVRNIEWLAGFLDGEGCFRFNINRCVVQVVQKDPWPIMKIHQLVGGRLYRVKGSCESGRFYYSLHLTGRYAVGLMLTLYPLLSPRRQQKIVECMGKWKMVLRRGAGNTKTHCKRGHELTPTSTFVRADGTGRECIVCSKIHKDNWYQRKKLTLVNSQ